ncbi:D-alanyl-D-alanine carboxypeptidase family protein [Metabacillus litoralis]|uniref:D-alanyl-D-alanine carboxypeptidase family protein n=1 Tax=Metabacillus litoralis TaxID=152268 RepID=UPI001CFEA399|nr:D-alanyl-D-alanine carboxypeptidase family protein [Metabacillus litoralis]
MKKNIVRNVCCIILCLALFPNTSQATNESLELSVDSHAAILLDSQSGQILYEKNSQEKLPPASITKIATAIYAIEKGRLDDSVTVSENARNVDGTRVYLEIGEEVPLKKLIQGLLLNSGNDAGVAIAEHLSGSVSSFAKELNSYLKEEIGVKNTNFMNPHGLYHPNHLTTAEDMAQITSYAMQNEVFREIFNTIELKWTGEGWDTTIINHHVMVRDQSYEGISGGKNGFVDESGFTLVTAANREKLSLVAVTLNTDTSSQAYKDATTLFDYGFNNFENETLPSNEKFTTEDDKVFVTTEELSYVKHIGETVTKEILPTGELVVKGEDNRIITSYLLEEVKNKEKEKQLKNEMVSPKIENEAADVGKSHLGYIVPISLLMSFVVSIFFYIQVRKV